MRLCILLLMLSGCASGKILVRDCKDGKVVVKQCNKTGSSSEKGCVAVDQFDMGEY